MTCKVLIWNFVGTKEAFGHASMEVTGGEPAPKYYVSWWPNCTPGGSNASHWEAKKREYFGMCEPMRARKMSDDIEAEFGNRPDKHVTLAGLDETAIKKFWDELIHDPKAQWSASTTNCAAAVVAGLKAGGAGKYFDSLDDLLFATFHTNWWAWTPASAYDYAVALQGKLREAKLMP